MRFCNNNPPFDKRKALSAALLALFAGTTLCAPAAQADPLGGKADLFLTRRAALHPKQGWASVIIKLNGDPTTEQAAQLKALKVDVYRHLPIIRSVAARVPSCNLGKLASLTFITHLSADINVRKYDEFTLESSGASIARAQYGLTGKGVGVAVLDSGIRTCQDLPGPSIITSVSFVPPPPGQSPVTNDLCGHGTHVAGIIAGNGSASTGTYSFRHFYGIAPQTKIANVRVLDQNGQGTVSQVISGIQWAITNRAAYNIRVINLSVGHPVGESYTTDPLCQAVEQAWKAGIVVVCAAGNEGRLNSAQTTGAANEGWGTAYGSIQSPGNDPYVITVGAMKNSDGIRSHDRIATYSSRGPSRLDYVMKPDLVAPGNKVISLDNNGSYLDTAYGGSNQIPQSTYNSKPAAKASAQYFLLSGTSMATPVVAGAAALLLQANPSLTPDTIKARLMISADKWANPDGTNDPCTYGAGFLNIPAALACTAAPGASAVSPTLVRDAAGNVSISNVLWGSNVIWGLNGVANPLNVIWGANILWGTNVIWGSNILWGTSVWTDNIIWGTRVSTVDLTSAAINGE